MWDAYNYGFRRESGYCAIEWSAPNNTQSVNGSTGYFTLSGLATTAALTAADAKVFFIFGQWPFWKNFYACPPCIELINVMFKVISKALLQLISVSFFNAVLRAILWLLQQYSANTMVVLQSRELRSDTPVQYLNFRIHEENLRSTPGQAEPIAQYFFGNLTPLKIDLVVMASQETTVYICFSRFYIFLVVRNSFFFGGGGGTPNSAEILCAGSCKK